MAFRTFWCRLQIYSRCASLGGLYLQSLSHFAFLSITPLRESRVRASTFLGLASWEYRWYRTEWIEYRSQPLESVLVYSDVSKERPVYMTCVVLLDCLSTGRGLFPSLDKCFQLFTYKLLGGWRIHKRRLKLWHIIPGDDWLCVIAVWLGLTIALSSQIRTRLLQLAAGVPQPIRSERLKSFWSSKGNGTFTSLLSCVLHSKCCELLKSR